MAHPEVLDRKSCSDLSWGFLSFLSKDESAQVSGGSMSPLYLDPHPCVLLWGSGFLPQTAVSTDCCSFS